MAIKATVKIDAGIEMLVYIKILDLSSITNHLGGSTGKATIRGYLMELIESGNYTNFKGDNPPPYCWGGEYGLTFDVNIDVSDKTQSVYEQAYNSLLSNTEFTGIVKNPVSA